MIYFRAPQFSLDETLCARNVTNEVQFFENGFETISDKLHLDKLAHFSLCPWGPPYLVAAYVAGTKGQPSSVKLYQRPNFSSVIGNNSFYREDDVVLKWNPRGRYCLGGVRPVLCCVHTQYGLKPKLLFARKTQREVLKLPECIN
jgi:uncharacterized protein with WD repeat